MHAPSRTVNVLVYVIQGVNMWSMPPDSSRLLHSYVSKPLHITPVPHINKIPGYTTGACQTEVYTEAWGKPQTWDPKQQAAAAAQHCWGTFLYTLLQQNFSSPTSHGVCICTCPYYIVASMSEPLL